jgi:hypothetical protein
VSELYYADESVTLYHGDAAEVLAALDLEAHVLLTDPPYFQVKDDEWDRQWRKADEFLGWLGGIVDLALPLLAPSATAWVFAGPALASRVEREVVAPRMRVLNSVRWVKEAGWHQKADIPAQRRYLTPWEAVILAERFEDPYAEMSAALHAQVFLPLGAYIEGERRRAGLDRNDVDVALGYVRTKDPSRGTELCRRWEEGSSLPTEHDYQRLRDLLNTRPGDYLAREYGDLRRECDALRSRFEDLRREQERPAATVRPEQTRPRHRRVGLQAGHGLPRQAPVREAAGHVAAHDRDHLAPWRFDPRPVRGEWQHRRRSTACGRRAVLIEKDERYCDAIASRLSQGDLFGEGIGA